MKKMLLVSSLVALSASVPAMAADVGFDVNINVGNRPKVIVPAPAPPVVIEEPPVFVIPPALGFYVAVGVPYDVFFISNQYYLYRDNVWYRAPGYNGPWVVVPHKRLPEGLRRHKMKQIRYYRDDEYRVYRGDSDHYRGRHFRPEKEWKERRKEEHERWKEEKRHEKEERKHGKGRGRED